MIRTKKKHVCGSCHSDTGKVVKFGNWGTLHRECDPLMYDYKMRGRVINVIYLGIIGVVVLFITLNSPK